MMRTIHTHLFHQVQKDFPFLDEESVVFLDRGIRPPLLMLALVDVPTLFLSHQAETRTYIATRLAEGAIQEMRAALVNQERGVTDTALLSYEQRVLLKDVQYSSLIEENRTVFLTSEQGRQYLLTRAKDEFVGWEWTVFFYTEEYYSSGNIRGGIASQGLGEDQLARLRIWLEVAARRGL
jgi:hypothetical protein